MPPASDRAQWVQPCRGLGRLRAAIPDDREPVGHRSFCGPAPSPTNHRALPEVDAPAARGLFRTDARPRGFTLLEVMIAMAILAITLVTLYRSQSQSLSMAADSRFLTTASLLAQGRLAEIETADPAGVVAGTGDFGEEYPGYTWRLEVGAVEELPLLNKMTLTVTQGRMAMRTAYRLILYKVVPQ